MKQKYINLYLNKSITKCVANAIQIGRSFLGMNDKAGSYLLVVAIFINNFRLFNIIRKKLGITQLKGKY